MKAFLPAKALWGRVASVLLSVAFPDGNTCHVCGQPMLHGEEAWLCGPCQTELARALIPASDQPLFIDPLIPRAVAAYPYLSIAQELVHQLKYRGDAAAAAPLSEGMASAFALMDSPARSSAQVVIPIPLHPKRQKERGYNQAALLAERLSFHTSLPCHPLAIERIRYTRSQVSANREHRLRNMVGAFTVTDIPLIYQKHVLLIDDVCTTGATAVACAHVLLACGAKEVSLLTACRA